MNSAPSTLSNPLDWAGPDFLKLYLVLLLGCFAWYWIERRKLLAPPIGSPPVPLLEAYHWAMLEGGPRRVLDAVLAALAARCLIRADSTTMEIGAVPAPDGQPHLMPTDALERLVFERVAKANVKIGALRAEMAGRMDLRKAELERQGLLLPDGKSQRVPLALRLFAVALCMLGAAKTLIGFARDRPVLYLMVLLLLAIVLLILISCASTHRTPLGHATLAQAKGSHAALSSPGTTPSPDAGLVPTIVALYGLGMVTHYGNVASLAPVLWNGQNGTSSAGGCGTSSCGSNSGGCGGCGGGGCGGGGGD